MKFATYALLASTANGAAMVQTVFCVDAATEGAIIAYKATPATTKT